MDFNRCYGCMRELEAPGAVCPHCGYDNTKDPQEQLSHVLPCGTILNGQYIVGRSLGQGGFGITYIAYDLFLKLRVCIREYFPEWVALRDKEQGGRVSWRAEREEAEKKWHFESHLREACRGSRLRGLSHAAMIRLVFCENETFYVVMDYIEGETLLEHLKRTKEPLREKECITLLAPVMQELETVHERQIIHRNIRPENIMLRPNGDAVLLDTCASDFPYDNQHGMFRRADAFKALENYRRNGNIGPWTDVYSVCATIIFCLSGTLPPDALDRFLKEKQDLDLKSFSPPVAKALQKGMAIRIKDRIQTMRELLEQLNATDVPQTAEDPPPREMRKMSKLATSKNRHYFDAETNDKRPHSPNVRKILLDFLTGSPKKKESYTGDGILKKYRFRENKKSTLSRVSFVPSELDGKCELTDIDTALFLWLFRTERFDDYVDSGLIADGTYLRFEQKGAGSIEFQSDVSISISGASGSMRLRFSDSSRSSLLYLNWLIQGIHAWACLDGVKGPYDGQSFPLKKGSTTIGRTEGDIRLPKDHTISNSEARIVYSEEQRRFVLHVEHTLNVVSLNGRRLFRGQKEILSDQDMIQMGKSVFRLTDGMGMKKL